MTVTPPRERARSARAPHARRRDRSARSPWRSCRSLGSRRRAGTPRPTPTPDARRSPPARRAFTLSPVGNGDRPCRASALSVSVTLQNGTDAATAPVTVTLSLGPTPLADRAALTAWLAATRRGGPTAEVGPSALEAVPPGGDAGRRHRVEADDPALADRAPGVYPLVATYESADGHGHVDQRDDRAADDDDRGSASASSSRSPRRACRRDCSPRDQLTALTAPTGVTLDPARRRRGHGRDPRGRSGDPGGDPRPRHVGARSGARVARPARGAAELPVRPAVRRRRRRRPARSRAVATARARRRSRPT